MVVLVIADLVVVVADAVCGTVAGLAAPFLVAVAVLVVVALFSTLALV